MARKTHPAVVLPADLQRASVSLPQSSLRREKRSRAGSHSCAAEIDLGTTTPRKKPGPENLGSGDETRELRKTRVTRVFTALHPDPRNPGS